MSKQLKVILIGAGNRGCNYVRLAKENCPEKLDVVAIADPDLSRGREIIEAYNIPEEMIFDDWKKVLALPKFADAAIIATQDNNHFEPACAALVAGYDLLLEKPVAPTAEECLGISDLANSLGRKVVVCHVLRYAPFFETVKHIIDSGRIGKVVNIVHTECVGNIHQSHSYVRGNWRDSKESSPMILAKSCHDLDIVQWLLGKECTRVQSFGSLSYFHPENAPEGAPEYCIQGCPHESECVYSAVKIYKERQFPVWVRYVTKKENATDEEIEKIISETNYGKCIFKCGNDVVDHQVVNLEYEDGETVSFTMSAFNKGGRKINVMGTAGELWANMADKTVHIFDFKTREIETIDVLNYVKDESIVGGHGGGDLGIIKAFCEYLTGEYKGCAVSDISTSVGNHLVAFAAESSRLSGKVISMKEFKDEIRGGREV
jgi:predicted dehydrogenase